MPSILIADDNPYVRGVVRSFLEGRPGLHATEAVDGLDAVEKATAQNPDLVILDFSMPRMNGLDAARALRTTMRDVPIILFTIYVDAVPPSELAKAGVTALVSKADIVGLLKRVESMLAA